jgi:hypothetical protein
MLISPKINSPHRRNEGRKEIAMVRLTDGKKTVEIEMTIWDGCNYSPDWSGDFFEVGGLPYDEETDTYTVHDVDCCIEQAEDWRQCRGDFADDVECYDVISGHERCVFVDE